MFYEPAWGDFSHGAVNAMSMISLVKELFWGKSLGKRQVDFGVTSHVEKYIRMTMEQRLLSHIGLITP